MSEIPPVGGGDHGIHFLFDLLGRRKALRVIWELRSDRHLTFRQLIVACETNPGALNARLKGLREAGFVALAAGRGFHLTESGRTLLRHLLPLYKWAEQWVADPDGR